MSNIYWNTNQIKEHIESVCDNQWKIELLSPSNKFETTTIKIYNSMIGKSGPCLLISGLYIPVDQNHVFDPDNDIINEILIGDNNCRDTLSIQNKHNILFTMYQKIIYVLTKLKYIQEPLTPRTEVYTDGYDNY